MSWHAREYKEPAAWVPKIVGECSLLRQWMIARFTSDGPALRCGARRRAVIEPEENTEHATRCAISSTFPWCSASEGVGMMTRRPVGHR